MDLMLGWTFSSRSGNGELEGFPAGGSMREKDRA